MNKYLIIIAFSALTSINSCNKRNNQSVQPKEPPQSTSAPTPAPATKTEAVAFIPPTDSMITLQRMNAWLQSNTYLDSLTFLYADSFKTLDPVLRIRYQEDFTSAQSKICVRAGLPGGYEEYTWIMKNSGNPKNKAVLDSANASIH